MTAKDDYLPIITFEPGDPDENPFIEGGPRPEVIEVVPHDPDWPGRYDILRAGIEAAIGAAALAVAHVGSTAVPGLAAKPVIDIDLIVADPEREDSYVPALEAIGYVLTIRERGWYGHRLLRRDDPRVNLHVFGPACPEHARHILFRNWLRERPAARQRYAEAKAGAKDDAETAADYNARKQDVVRDIYREIFTARGWIGSNHGGK